MRVGGSRGLWRTVGVAGGLAAIAVVGVLVVEDLGVLVALCLLVPVGFACVVSLLGLVVTAAEFRNKRRYGLDECPSCGYPRAQSGPGAVRCSECGTEFAAWDELHAAPVTPVNAKGAVVPARPAGVLVVAGVAVAMVFVGLVAWAASGGDSVMLCACVPVTGVGIVTVLGLVVTAAEFGKKHPSVHHECPSCGYPRAQSGPGAVRCSECGTEFAAWE